MRESIETEAARQIEATALEKFFDTEIYVGIQGNSTEHNLGSKIAANLLAMDYMAQNGAPITTEILKYLFGYVSIINDPENYFRAADPTKLNTDNIIPTMMFHITRVFYRTLIALSPEQIYTETASDLDMITLQHQELLGSIHMHLMLYIGTNILYMPNPDPEVAQELLNNIIVSCIRLTSNNQEMLLLTAYAVPRLEINLPINFYAAAQTLLDKIAAITDAYKHNFFETKKPNKNAVAEIIEDLLHAGILDPKQFKTYFEFLILNLAQNQIQGRNTRFHRNLICTTFESSHKNFIAHNHALFERRKHNALRLTTMMRELTHITLHDFNKLITVSKEITDESDINYLYEQLRNDSISERMLATTSLKYRYNCTLFNRNLIDMSLVNNQGQPLVTNIQRFMQRECTRLTSELTAEELDEITRNIEQLPRNFTL